MSPDTKDDIDRLMARLRPIDPPADFVLRVALATYAAQGTAAIGRHRLWVALDAAALLVLAAVSIWFGMALEETGAIDLVALLVADVGAAGQGLGAMFDALLAAVPWLQFALLAANAAVVAALSHLAMRGAPPARYPAV